jgi:ribosomal-protein-serine acetyltransferase
MRFSVDLGDSYAVALRTADTVKEMHALTVRNIDRLREWEPWAGGEQSVAGTAAYTRLQLDEFVTGSAVPGIITRAGEAIGAVSLKIREATLTAELGYWVDRDEEGRGAATRACRLLLEHAATIGMRRLEIRTPVANSRSIALAERLGCHREAVLPEALAIGASRLDVAIYVLVLSPLR